MLYYDRIDISEVIDINKTNTLKRDCIFCHYRQFLDKRLKFQLFAWNRCHDVFMMSIDINSILILNIHSVDHLCIINEITKMLI